MKVKIVSVIILITILQEFAIFQNLFGCSVVKITCNGKTVVGNNEDFWDPDTRIWFEPGIDGNYGAVYVGYSYLLPEGGMNEKGLMFDGLAVNDKDIIDTLGKAQIDETELKKKIMKECSTVEEVKKLVNEYNISFWSRAVWLFVDKSGKYLIIDGDSLISGKNNYCVQTNFHPSDIKNGNDIDCWRYKKAMALLNKNYDSSINYCTSLMDSIHWSGTRYTTVYDLNNTTVYMYFSHDYKKSVKFNLKTELKKGEKVFIIPDLFPENTNAYNYYKDNMKIKSTLAGLENAEIVRDSLKMLEIKNIVMNIGTQFLVQKYLNNYGYDWLFSRKNNSNAIIIFKMNIELFPQSSDAFDSLGEAYMEDKQYHLALTSYLRSVELDPNNTNGKEKIISLKKILTK